MIQMERPPDEALERTKDFRTRRLSRSEGFYNRTRRHSAIGYISPVRWRSLKAANPCPFFSGDNLEC